MKNIPTCITIFKGKASMQTGILGINNPKKAHNILEGLNMVLCGRFDISARVYTVPPGLCLLKHAVMTLVQATVVSVV